MTLSNTLAAMDAHHRRARRSRARAKHDPWADPELNCALTRISEGDRLNPRLAPRDGIDLEVRAAMAAYPQGDGLDRVLTCCRILRVTMPGIADHLTDEHLRHLWRTRGEQ